MRIDDCQFVVVDCETTGLHPGAHHRVIELALVPLDRDLEPADRWVTLLRPDRDLGPTEIHGIRGRDLLDAPSFDEVLGEVLERLAGRVLVAHNAVFDRVFLEAELRRASVQVGELPALCTMRLAGLAAAPGRLRLADCCAELGYEPEGEHTALGDALACAALLAEYLPAATAAVGDQLEDFGCRLPVSTELWPRSARRAPCKCREGVRQEPREPSFLAKLAQAVGRSDGGDGLAVAPYLDLLDRALEDRRLEPLEQEDLAAMAAVLGLSRERVRSVHADYVGTLIAFACRDGVVTDRERADLELVADALGVAGLEKALSLLAGHLPDGDQPPDDLRASLVGKSVCFTGALCCSRQGEAITRERAHKLAEAAGLIVATRVTRGLDLLVVADPHSMSGKAKKARDYGTRIVAETAFWPMIGVDVC